MSHIMPQHHGIDQKLRWSKSVSQELSNEVLLVQIEQPELPSTLIVDGNTTHKIKSPPGFGK